MGKFTGTVIATVLILMPGGLAGAADQTMERLVGSWASPDGANRQQVERSFDGTWLTTRQWFNQEGNWVLAGRGAIYSKPGTSSWVGATRTTQMGGIVLFESIIEPGTDLFVVENRAYTEDGSVLETAEEWRFPSADRIDYVVYRVTDGGREAWMKGSWVRQAEGW